ncbi:MAG: hypothetical protein IBX68_11360 [Dehalococcoidia bacterium]|nr:hypothetical protein [Dehalococcoidia bacterium]
MARKSRRTAARYSEISKERKKKQRGRAPLLEDTASEPITVAVPEQAQTRYAPYRTAPAARSDTKEAAAEYSHVKEDLRVVGIISGAMLTLLIVLSFVLG